MAGMPWRAVGCSRWLSWRAAEESERQLTLAPRVTAFELTLPPCNGLELTLPRGGESQLKVPSNLRTPVTL